MKKMKMGTPVTGVVIGLSFVALAALVMIIGFWKTLVLAVLFGIGFFIGTVDNKQEFIRNAANRIIPAKEAKVIDIKSEIARDQEERQEEIAYNQEERQDNGPVTEEKSEDGE